MHFLFTPVCSFFLPVPLLLATLYHIKVSKACKDSVFHERLYVKRYHFQSRRCCPSWSLSRGATTLIKEKWYVCLLMLKLCGKKEKEVILIRPALDCSFFTKLYLLGVWNIAAGLTNGSLAFFLGSDENYSKMFWKPKDDRNFGNSWIWANESRRK